MHASVEGVSLHVTDLERSIVFYTRIPGAILERQRPGVFARFRIGTGCIHLVQVANHRFHIELNTDNLQSAHEALRGAGFEPTTPQTHPWGKTDFRLIDPDGYALEFGGPG
jgi:catechol 2,3-dioxygenase-like lactoylglutathione lyase family enzyme